MVILGIAAALLITLGLGQLSARFWRLQGVALAGWTDWRGYALGLLLLIAGTWLLPPLPELLLWAPLGAILAVGWLIGVGPVSAAPAHPDRIFSVEHPAHKGCRRIEIPDGAHGIPGILLTPTGESGLGVCIIPGAGDTKTSFKWRLVQTLLEAGITVLTIDPPGHGDYRHRPLDYPDCLSTIPAAVLFLRNQAAIRRVGVIGISLGGALALSSAAYVEAEQAETMADYLVVISTPTRLNYSSTLFYRVFWNTIFRSDSLSLTRELTVRQVLESWRKGGYRSPHGVDALIGLLDPEQSLARIRTTPVLLVYSRRDQVAPATHGQILKQIAPQAHILEEPRASHVMLTLTPTVNHQVAAWLVALYAKADQ